jgi:hypothetical protein
MLRRWSRSQPGMEEFASEAHLVYTPLEAPSRLFRNGRKRRRIAVELDNRVANTYGTGIFLEVVREFLRSPWRQRHHHRLPPRAAAGSAEGDASAASGTPLATDDTGEDRRRLELAGAKLHLSLPCHYRIRVSKAKRISRRAACVEPWPFSPGWSARDDTVHGGLGRVGRGLTSRDGAAARV